MTARLGKLCQLGEIGGAARDVVDQAAHAVAARKAELAPDEIGGLDAVGALVDRRDARVAIMLRGAGFLDEAHPAMDLHAEAGDLAADVGRVGLGERDEDVGAARGGFVAELAEVGLRRCIIDQRARGLGLRAHPPQHPLDVGVVLDRDRRAVGAARERRLDALGGVALGLLQRALGDLDALTADHQARVVHHHEHRLHAAHLVADDLAEAILALAIDHHRGRRAVDAELVLDRGAMDTVRDRRIAGIVEAIFGDDEKRDAARPLGRARRAREDEVDDIVGEVMLAEGDEDLLALDPVEARVRTFGDLLGGRAQRADIAARARLGQVHRAVPFAVDQLGQPGLALIFGAIGHQRMDRARGQDRAEGEPHVRGAQRLDRHRRQRERQVLSAIFGRAVEAAPARLDELPIRLLEARGHGDPAVFPFRVGDVADAVERRIDLGREIADAGDDRLDQVGGCRGISVVGGHRVDARDMVEDEKLFGGGRRVGHAEPTFL